MKIAHDMDIAALVEILGGGTATEAEALRRSLATVHNGMSLEELPQFILNAHINHALAAMPDDIPGEFYR